MAPWGEHGEPPGLSGWLAGGGKPRRSPRIEEGRNPCYIEGPRSQVEGDSGSVEAVASNVRKNPDDGSTIKDRRAWPVAGVLVRWSLATAPSEAGQRRGRSWLDSWEVPRGRDSAHSSPVGGVAG